MYKKVEGIIISEMTYKDSSKIINIFTEEGVIGVIAKGAKKIKKPFFATTGKFTYGVFNIFYKENGLSSLIEVDVINNYSKIKKDIKLISYVTYITELSTRVYNHEQNKNIYELYISCLNKINEGYDPLVITNIIKLKLLDYLGIRPVIDKCVICGNKTDIITISSYYGGYVCKNCYKDEKIVSPKTISLIRMLYYVDINKITKLDISSKTIKEIDEFTDDYYDRYSGIYLKSKILLETIK